LPAVKEKIVDKATELFLNFGFKSITMDDIARELSMSKKTIYSYFENKSALVSSVTQSIYSTVTSGIDWICQQQLNPIEELYEIKKFVSLQLKDEKSSPQFQLQKYYPEIFQQIKGNNFELIHDITLNNLRRGIEQGLYRDNVNVEFVARIYFIGMTGIKDDTVFPITQFPKINLIESYLEYHLRGIVTKKGLSVLNKYIDQSTP
jgi:AcrR family transcriptional regulator